MKVHKTLLLRLILLVCVVAPSGAWAAFFSPDIRPGYGVTSCGWLSDYFPPLRGTHMDTPVFFLDSGTPGATFLVLGGTHAREIAGYTAATVLVENVRAAQGRLIVIPHANSSAMSVRDEQKGIKRFHEITSRSGKRFLPYGNRYTDPADQGVKDPETYIHPSGYQLKKGAESRNLNRAYPGKAHGTPTQQLAHAVIELINRERVDFCLDLHEAGTPEAHLDTKGKTAYGGRLAYMLVCHPTGAEIGAMVILAVEDEIGRTLKLEKSNPAFRGLSHLEIGNATKCISFLFETPNPGQDRWREAPDVIGDPKYPLTHRVALALRVVKYLAESYGDMMDSQVVLEGIPGYRDIMEKGVEAFLN